jgi:hypothetical protein
MIVGARAPSPAMSAKRERYPFKKESQKRLCMLRRGWGGGARAPGD